jgi:hypothetical protein
MNEFRPFWQSRVSNKNIQDGSGAKKRLRAEGRLNRPTFDFWLPPYPLQLYSQSSTTLSVSFTHSWALNIALEHEVEFMSQLLHSSNVPFKFDLVLAVANPTNLFSGKTPWNMCLNSTYSPFTNPMISALGRDGRWLGDCIRTEIPEDLSLIDQCATLIKIFKRVPGFI